MAQAHMQAQAETEFKNARQQYLSAEAEAYKDYEQDKESGMTNDDFYRWMQQNAPAVTAAQQNLGAAGAKLGHIWQRSGESQERLKMLNVASNPTVILPGVQGIRRYDEDRPRGPEPSLRDYEKKKMDDVLNL